MANNEESSPLLTTQPEDEKPNHTDTKPTAPEKKENSSEKCGWTVDGLPLGNGSVVGEPVPRSQWNSGLCACLGRNDEFCSSDLEVCLLGSLAPCVLYGSNAERLGSSPGTFANHCLPYTGLYLLGNALYGWNCMAPLFSHPTRSQIRRQFNLEFTMELAGTESGNAPRCYSMDMFKDISPMCAFAQATNGKVSVEGKVVNKLEMKPHTESFREYGKLCRERTNKYMIKHRQLQVIDDDRTMRIMPGMTAFLPATSKQDKKKAVPAKGTETKRTRRDRGEVEHIIFKLLERQPNWTLRQLIQETDQPEQFVKDILKELCIYNNKGANQGTYELKTEYKRSSGETDT